MLAVTTDKALLRAVWEITVLPDHDTSVDINEAASYLNGITEIDREALEIDARLLEDFGFLELSSNKGSRSLTLTEAGAFLATRIELSK